MCARASALVCICDIHVSLSQFVYGGERYMWRLLGLVDVEFHMAEEV